MSNSTIKQAQELAKQAKQLVQKMKHDSAHENFKQACIKKFGRELVKGDVIVCDWERNGEKVPYKFIGTEYLYGSFEVNFLKTNSNRKWADHAGWCLSTFKRIRFTMLAGRPKYQTVVEYGIAYFFGKETQRFDERNMYHSVGEARAAVRKFLSNWKGKHAGSEGYVTLYDKTGNHKDCCGSISIRTVVA